MKENKNIERLFQEKFKDFEAIPPLESWANIEERLNQKKKKRRVIPFWFKTSGIAATLILGMFIFKNVNDNSINNINKIDINTISNVETSTSSEELIEDTNNGSSSINNPNVLNEGENSIVVSQGNNNLSNKENILVNDNNLIKSKKSNVINSNNPIVVSNSKKDNSTNKEKTSVNNKNSIRTEKYNSLNSNNSTVVSNSKNKGSRKEQTNITANKTEEVVSNSVKGKLNINTSNVEFKQTNKLSSYVVTSEKKGKTTSNKLNLNLSNEVGNSNEGLVINNSLDSNKNNLPTKFTNGINANKSTNAIIATNTININNMNPDSLVLVQNNIIANAIQDSALVAEVNTEENPLEKLLKEKLEGKNVDEKEKEKRNKWAVSTNASPIYFNSTTEGSPIDEQFTENEKAYASSLSYGVGIEYEISKRFSIKSGVNSLAVNYNTNNVFYETNIGAVKQDNINISRNQNALNVSLSNTNRAATSKVSESFNEINQGSLKQEIGFVEVPLEVSYKLLDRKFGINLTGGMSTLFLNTNTVSLISNGTEMDLGTANNLNNIHFSSNVGLGFKYTFWKSFQANFQPTFKYQINTFSNDSGNFKPYFIGLYSGISFSF